MTPSIRGVKYCTAGLQGDERGLDGQYPPPPNYLKVPCSRYFVPKIRSCRAVSPKLTAFTTLPLL